MSRMDSKEHSIAGLTASGEATHPADAGVVVGVRIAHDTASVDEIESVDGRDQRAMLAGLLARDAVAEAFVLRTCHRVEAYVVTDVAPVGRRVLGEALPVVDARAPVAMDHEESLRHLLRVAAGLESIVIGEDQILGQVQDAYLDARAVGAIGPVLEPAVLKAIHVGKRARTETSINDGVRSIGSATVALVDEQRDIDGGTALVIGAGEIGALTANVFADSGIETLYIANRSVPRAWRVADDVALDDARAIGLDALSPALADADVVVSATSSDDYILERDHLGGCGRTLIVDIARPRDVSPTVTAIDGVTVRDPHALESVIDEADEQRQSAVDAVEAIVEREFERLQEQYRRERADAVIATIYRHAEEIKSREVSKAVSRLEAQGDAASAQREIVSSMADALISRLLADPTMRLREAAGEGDWAMLENASRLFDFGSDAANVTGE